MQIDYGHNVWSKLFVLLKTGHFSYLRVVQSFSDDTTTGLPESTGTKGGENQETASLIKVYRTANSHLRLLA